MDNDYFNGRYGMGAPDYDNHSWQLGNQDRLNEIHRQQEEQRAAEQRRAEESLKAWSDAMKPPPAPDFSWPTASATPWSGGGGEASGASGSIGFDHGPAAAPSPPSTAPSASYPAYSGGGYYAPSLWERFVDLICTPFRWAWAVIKFAAKAALVVLLVVAAIYVAVNATERGAPASSVPEGAQTRPTFVAPTPTLEAPAQGAPTIVAPTDELPNEAPAGEVPTDPVAAEARTAEAPASELEAAASPYPRVGVQVRDLSPEDRSRLELGPDQAGTLVVSVLPDSPAADARLQPDDVIVSLNFEDVLNRDGFIHLVRSQRSGVEVPIAFYRYGIKHTKNIAPRLQD